MKKNIKFLITFLITFILIFSLNNIPLQARPLLFAPQEKVEIYCAWNDDFNCLARAKLYELLKNKYPNVEIINAHIACYNKNDINNLLIKRILEVNPPDIFQVHCGPELINNLVKTGSVSSITNLLNDMDIMKKINPQILKMYSYEGEVYALPLTIHRGNVVFYNKNLLKQHNISPPQNIYSLLVSMHKLREKGITPLAVGNHNSNNLLHIFENILLETVGIYSYQDFCSGNITLDGLSIMTTLQLFKKTTSYMNDNYNEINWQKAVEMVSSGEAAYTFMGDWALTYFKKLGAVPGKDIGWIFTGSPTHFMVVSEGFSLPRETNNLEMAEQWLKTIATKEVQENICKIKGSISTRMDVLAVINDPYLNDPGNDLVNNMHLYFPSMAYGSAASDDLVYLLNQILANYIVDGKTRKAQSEMITVFNDNL